MDTIISLLTFLFLFLVHVLALATNHIFFFVFVHPTLTLWKPDLLFSLASNSSSLVLPPALHLHSKCFQNKLLFLLFFTSRIWGEREDFLFLYTLRSYDLTL